MSTPTKLFMFWCIIFLFCTSALSAQQCDPALIEQMRTIYNSDSGDTIQQMIKKQACKENQKLGVNPDSGTFDADLSKACSSDDESYFSHHYREVALSFLPPEAFESLKLICSSGGPDLSLKTVDDGTEISLSAFWSGARNIPTTKVMQLKWSGNIQTCDGPLIPHRNSYPILGTGGLFANCKRKAGDNSDATFSILTDNGMQIARVYGKQHYELLVYYVDDELQCSVDDTQVLDQGLYFKGVFDGPPITKVDLDYLLTKPGKHVLKCKIIDTGKFEGHWCFKYKYELRQNDKVLTSRSPYDCNENTPHPPPDIPNFKITIR